jgi:hypothetical protein
MKSLKECLTPININEANKDSFSFTKESKETVKIDYKYKLIY